MSAQQNSSSVLSVLSAGVGLGLAFWCFSISGDLTAEKSPSCLGSNATAATVEDTIVLDSLAHDWRLVCDKAHSWALMSIVSSAIAMTGAFVKLVCPPKNEFEGPNPLVKLVDCAGSITGIIQLVFLIQFLNGYADISDPCDGMPDFEELTKIHTFIIVSFILYIVLCCCTCLAMSAQAATMSAGMP